MVGCKIEAETPDIVWKFDTARVTMTMMMMMMTMMTMMGPETPHCLTFSLHVPLWRPVPHPPRAVEAP